jgi:CheY-like chemotaxis protein
MGELKPLKFLEAHRDAAALERRHVLIVEDDVDCAALLREALELCEHSVSVARDVAEALRTIRENRPDTVFCDIHLPGLRDGYGLAREVRDDQSLNETVLVALSGMVGRDHSDRARAAGFDAQLTKPAELSQLERAVFTPRRA